MLKRKIKRFRKGNEKIMLIRNIEKRFLAYSSLVMLVEKSPKIKES